jgi:hypothetical protein
LRRLVLGCALQFGLHMTGVAAIQYYSPQIFAAYVSSFSSHNPLIHQ